MVGSYNLRMFKQNTMRWDFKRGFRLKKDEGEDDEEEEALCSGFNCFLVLGQERTEQDRTEDRQTGSRQILIKFFTVVNK